MNNQKYDAVFEGGGVKGIALIGALKRLEEKNIELSRVAGTSAGAITAALIAAGYKADEIKDILWKKNFNDFANAKIFVKKRWCILFSWHIFNLVSLLFARTGYGIFSTDAFYEWIKELLKAKGITDFKSCPIYLRVFAVDLLRQKLLQYDKDICPDLEVAEAIRRSMSIPLFFHAKIEKEALIVDGGVLANYPIDTFRDKDKLVSTIGLKLISKDELLPPSFPKNIFAYIMRIFETMQVAKERIHVEEAHWAKTIPIPTGKISTINFNLTEEDKQFLWDSGFQAADKAIKEGLLTESGRKSLKIAKSKIIEWAKTKHCIKQIFIYGSRARGDFIESSDLDIAVVIDKLSGDENELTTWISEGGIWQKELQRIIPEFKIHLEWFDIENNTTPTVKEKIKKGNILIYSNIIN